MSNFTLPSEDELRSRLTPEEYDILRNKATEIPYTGDFLTATPPGTYVCKVCGQPLFESTAKFDSMMGWPSFDQAISGSVVEAPDTSHGLQRVAVACSRCGSHIANVLEQGPTETGRTYNVNSASLVLDTSKIPAPRAPKPARDTEETTANEPAPATPVV